jgi:hypothetical protein
VCCDRIIQNEGLPVWDETDMMLVGQTEVDADENLQLQLWDSGKFTFLCFYATGDLLFHRQLKYITISLGLSPCANPISWFPMIIN